ncbi:hypothetical protein DMUE_6326 [Dictyocoela muelleri]|nr:hypothetical protein DMUE_6326 [Dictyocoela muelleri]
MLKYIKNQTNKRIFKKNKNFEYVTIKLRTYTRIFIGMGLKNISNYKKYWNNKSKIMFCNVISKCMSLKRFTEINSSITCISQKDYPKDLNRKISNEPKIFKFMNKIFSNSHNLEENICIDESTIPSKEMLSLRYIIQTKLPNIE